MIQHREVMLNFWRLEVIMHFATGELAGYISAM